MNNSNPIASLIGIAFSYVFLAGFFAALLMISGHFTGENFRDKEAPIYMEIVNDKYTPSYVGSAAYWEERHEWYKWGGSGCRRDRDVCTSDNAELFSHEDYINNRYENVLKRMERLSKN